MKQPSFLDLLDPQPVTLPSPAAAIPMAPDPLAAFRDRVPVRLQRSRKRGARTPAGASSIGRGTLFANPIAGRQIGHARGVLFYDNWLEARLSDLVLERHGFCPAEIGALHRLRERVQQNLWRLWRRDLVCSCPLTSRWCHGNPLIRHANEDIARAILFEAQRLHNEAAARLRARR